MKKIRAILLSLLLLGSTFGVSIEKHFCGGHLADVALFTGAGCGCDDDNGDNGCCTEENEVFRADLGEFSIAGQRVPNATEQNLLTASVVIDDVSVDSASMGSHDNIRPPPNSVPIYKLNCSYTYYG